MYPRIILASVLLASGAIAQNTAGYVSAVISYDETLATDAQYLTAVEMLLTIAPGYYASLQAQATGTNLGQQFSDSAYDIYTKLPSPYNLVISSVFNAERSIASKYGFIETGVGSQAGTASATSTSASTGTAAAGSSASSASQTGSTTGTTSSPTLVAGTTPTGFATSSTGTSSTTSSSSAMAATTGVPLVAGIAAIIGGLAIGL